MFLSFLSLDARNWSMLNPLLNIWKNPLSLQIDLYFLFKANKFSWHNRMLEINFCQSLWLQIPSDEIQLKISMFHLWEHSHIFTKAMSIWNQEQSLGFHNSEGWEKHFFMESHISFSTYKCVHWRWDSSTNNRLFRMLNNNIGRENNECWSELRAE